VGLKSAVLRFLERRNYAVVHADALAKEREAAAKNRTRLQALEMTFAPAPARAERPIDGPCAKTAAKALMKVLPSPATPPGANDLNKYAGIFDGIVPWSGTVPAECIVDFLGTLTRTEFLDWEHRAAHPGGGTVQSAPPSLADDANGEFWFEAVAWVQAAREARGRYAMITLGANYGYQAVGACRALQLLNPMPYKLVAVEPIPESMEWVRRNMRDNGIDPDEQWLLQKVIGASDEPAFFPMGSPGLGAQNLVATNDDNARALYFEACVAQGRTEEALQNLVLRNTTGLQQNIIEGKNFFGEIKFVNTVTLADVLGPLERVDLLESDLQESEILVFPPFRRLLKRKVHRIHLGTHGKDVHRALLRMFIEDGWEIVFTYEPDSVHETALGTFEMNDGVLSVRNPAV
jgi:hypothetical protein